MEIERQTAFRIAHQAKTVGADPQADPQAEILAEQRRTRLHRELTADWSGRNGGPTLQEYEAALVSGDELRIEALEIYGPAAIPNDDMRNQFSRRVEESRLERLPEEQRQALEDLEKCKRAEFELGVALGFKDRTSRELIEMSPAEISDSRTVI